MKRIIRLTESDLTRIVRRVINEKQYLTEERIIPITIDIPAKRDEKGVLKAIPNSRLNFQIINQKGTGGEMTDDFNTVPQVHWQYGSAKSVSKKDANGNVTGSFVPDEAGLKVLSKLVGQKDITGDLGMKVTLSNSPQPGSTITLASPTVRFKERPIQK
jgi:hypothetical protein